MRKKRDFSVPIYDEINVTPLIDTLFFLLIIFMLTAPLLEYSIDVTTPEMNADKLPDSDDRHSKVVNYKTDGTIVFNKENMTRGEFLTRLEDLKRDPEAKLYLRADEALPYGDVIRFLSEIRKTGFTSIFLVTSEETK